MVDISKNRINVSIREMELEDLPSVFALGEKLFTSESWPNLYRTWDDYEVLGLFSSDRETCLVAEINDKLAGFVLGSIIEKRRCAWTYGYVVWLGIDPEFARAGVGRKLVEKVTDIFIENGVRMVMADTDAENHPAIRFFEKMGYHNKRKHVYMSCNLAQHPDYAKAKPRKIKEHK